MLRVEEGWRGKWEKRRDDWEERRIGEKRRRRRRREIETTRKGEFAKDCWTSNRDAGKGGDWNFEA